ncbi:hypothetical protein [Pseudooceanicola sp. MF1-13]|uniref:hypothetical protein n=1 Tax=Pseudooceanicola sp. MF1-13 TaxID=3379095 RepID=UPI003892585D
MGLITGLLGGGSAATGTTNSGGATSTSTTATENAANTNTTADPTETNTAVTAPDETQSSESTSTNTTGSNVYYYSRPTEAEADTGRASVDTGDLTLRDDEVIAVDYARRAAIAAQAKAKVESLLDGLTADPKDDSAYLQLSAGKADADGAYAKADAASPRYGEKVSYDA